jgi:hypothetical protein
MMRTLFLLKCEGSPDWGVRTAVLLAAWGALVGLQVLLGAPDGADRQRMAQADVTGRCASAAKNGADRSGVGFRTRREISGF